jgi:putative addiction module component (TIGR02574 family)
MLFGGTPTIVLETVGRAQFLGGWSMEFDTVLTEVDAWLVGDRIRLMNELWNRLVDQGHEPELSEEMKAELDRRLTEDDAEPDDVVPWAEVKQVPIDSRRRFQKCSPDVQTETGV